MKKKHSSQKKNITLFYVNKQISFWRWLRFAYFRKVRISFGPWTFEIPKGFIKLRRSYQENFRSFSFDIIPQRSQYHSRRNKIVSPTDTWLFPRKSHSYSFKVTAVTSAKESLLLMRIHMSNFLLRWIHVAPAKNLIPWSNNFAEDNDYSHDGAKITSEIEKLAKHISSWYHIKKQQRA